MNDDAAVRTLNRWARASPRLAMIIGCAAERLAVLEVGLMLLLGLSGRRQSALRMLAAVGAVYAASELLGRAWPRPRPFERLDDVTLLATHSAGRSFPSRHVASGLAMATIGAREHARLGWLMAAVAWALGISRVAAGLHYPSDVGAGAALGRLVGDLFTRGV
ncbi:MAG: phosphatase PAP2 family protein [Chloroflexi bacterium]|nr:phosphatase PAP2 family protein [Chloroflexota bacterium]MBV9599136.1 phosphatase PAP2 family protein [Chloroflexota bacterium]